MISDSGEVWKGDAAWIMVLWALRETREWSLRLASPALRPLARAACHLLSQNRYTISRWLAGDSAEDLGRSSQKLREHAARLLRDPLTQNQRLLRSFCNMCSGFFLKSMIAATKIRSPATL